MRRSGLLRFTRRSHLISSDWLLNVLHLLNTKVHKGHRQDLAYLIVRRAGDTHGPGFRDCLQPRRYVHSVTKQVSSPNHHVADMHTNAEADAAVGCETGVRTGQGSLRIHGALYRVNGASELREDTVARRVRNTA